MMGRGVEVRISKKVIEEGFHIGWRGEQSILYKTLRGSPKGKFQRGLSASGGFGRYKWYQSQTPGDLPTRRLSPEGGWA